MANTSAWQDLLQWQSEIRKKDELLSRRKPIHEEPLPPIRPSVDMILDGQKPVGLGVLTKESNAAIAKTEKEKGNQFFQKKEYHQAVEHYGRAIELDPTVSVYYLNRAMAYLKLNKFVEVERDCTQGLQLEPQNVKALWRRGIALRELGRPEEARADFQSALTIDPGNNAIVAELNKLPAKPSTITTSTSTTTRTRTTPSIPVPEEKRTLPIKVIDAAYTGFTTGSSSSTIASSSTTTDINKEDKIHVSSPAKTVAKEQKELAEVSLHHTPLKLECPRTNFEFERDWKACRHRGNDMLYQYFQCIPPSSYASLFKSSLESDQFEKMIEIIDKYYFKEKTEKEIYDVLEGLSRVRRMDMLVMFLSRDHLKVLQNIFDTLKGSVDHDRLAAVAKVYRIKV
ncbi:hypothetical protein EC973_005757 [Apophysomyces ossiformis]|uniref:RNA polymerase II-associated protein 3 n=1 Tax=Apophysomyces ossiformis TaxID=679940 RepID=A0A8H7BER8_9FUNG|nr:hypothetical protein EC973_005757 [Apophysomyces ossiformis]